MPKKKAKPTRGKSKRHPTKSKELGSARGPSLRISPRLGLLFSIFALAVAFSELTANGETSLYILFFVLGLLILLPNAIWALFKWTNPFVVPYILTMVRTHHFVKTLQSIASWGKIWEKVCIVGLFLGFGLAGVDYWVAREKSGWKRIAILFVSAIALFFVLWGVSLLMMPRIPALFEPLIGISIISFILLGFGGLSLAFMMGYGFMAVNALLTGQNICPSVAPVIPGVPIPGFGVAIPLIAWISLGLILVIHEGSHGIMMAYYKTKIRSVGLLLAGIFPMGAFVEQDDKQFAKMDDKQRSLILSAGPSFNFLTVPFAIVLMLAVGLVAAPMINPINEQMYSGVKVSTVEEVVGYCGDERVAPALGNFEAGDIIVSMNGTNVESINDLQSTVFAMDMQEFVVLRDGKEVDVNVLPAHFETIGISRMGVGFEAIRTDYQPWLGFELFRFFITSLLTVLNLLWILSLAVGMFNFLPSDPLDGGRIAKSVLRPYFGFLDMGKKETELLIGRLFMWVFLLAILLNLIPYITLFT